MRGSPRSRTARGIHKILFSGAYGYGMALADPNKMNQ
jgi:hypothetical protein